MGDGKVTLIMFLRSQHTADTKTCGGWHLELSQVISNSITKAEIQSKTLANGIQQHLIS